MVRCPAVASRIARALANAEELTKTTALSRAKSRVNEEQVDRVLRLALARWRVLELARLRSDLPGPEEVEPNLLHPEGLVPDVPPYPELDLLA